MHFTQFYILPSSSTTSTLTGVKLNVFFNPLLPSILTKLEFSNVFVSTLQVNFKDHLGQLSMPSQTSGGVEILIFHWIFLASWEKQLQGIVDKGKKEFFDFGMFQTHHKFVEGWRGPLYRSKKSFSVYRVHGIQNNRLELTVSTQQSVLKNMHRIPRY